MFVPGFISNLELYWELPAMARFMRRLASFSRLGLRCGLHTGEWQLYAASAAPGFGNGPGYASSTAVGGSCRGRA